MSVPQDAGAASMRARLAELQAEYESGQSVLRDLAAEQQRVREALLRIDGAIQVLNELLEGRASDGDSPSAGAPS